MQKIISVNKKELFSRIKYFVLSLVPFVMQKIISLIALGIVLLFNLEEFLTIKSNDELLQNFLFGISPAGTLIMHGGFVIVFGFWYSKIRHKCDEITINPSICLITAFAFGFIAKSVVLIQERFFPAIVQDYEQVFQKSWGGAIFIYIVVAWFIAPIGEELIYRGVVLSYAKKSLPFWFANILQALLFGIMHGNFVQGAYAFLSGLIFGYIAEKYNTIIPTVIIHFLMNSVIGMVWVILFPENLPMTLYIIISISLIFWCFYLVKKR